MMVLTISRAFALATFASWASAACVPDVPEDLLANKNILGHPAVMKALDDVEKLLQKPYGDNVTRDGLSFAIVGNQFTS